MGVAGKYSATGVVMGSDMDCNANFIVEGNVLTGTILTMGNLVEILDGEVDGDTFKCACKVPTPMGQMRIKLNGTVTGDEIEFTLKNPMGKSVFTGTRVE